MRRSTQLHQDFPCIQDDNDINSVHITHDSQVPHQTVWGSAVLPVCVKFWNIRCQLFLKSQLIPDLRCPYRWCSTGHRYKLSIRLLSTDITLPAATVKPKRTQHLRHHAMRGILASRGHRCTHDFDRLPWMRTQPSGYGAIAASNVFLASKPL